MGRATKFCVLLAAIVALTFMMASPAMAIAVDPGYWQVDEYVQSDQYSETVSFGVTNQHPTDALIGFAVTMHPDVGEIFDRGVAADWYGEVCYMDRWDDDDWSYMTASSDSTVKKSAEWFFGGTWEELFGDEDTDRAFIFWSKQNEDPINSIPAGETWGGDPSAPVFYFTWGDETGGFSTAAVRMSSGYTASGDVDVAHAFDSGTGGAAIPEPATMLLLGVGLAGTVVRSRRRRR